LIIDSLSIKRTVKGGMKNLKGINTVGFMGLIAEDGTGIPFSTMPSCSSL
jgi:hypothetical protein